MAQTELRRRLSSLDAAFLYFEKSTQPMHIGGVTVYEDEVSREELVQVLLDRLHLLPRYRQKVVFPPFGIAHPTWEDDPAFDINNHVDEIILPAPGDDRVLSEVGGRAYAPMLDRAHPLWKLILVQGHETGRTHLIWKIHHCMVDGVSGVDLGLVLQDFKPQEGPAEPPPPWNPQPMLDPLSLLQDAVRDRLTDIVQAWTDETFRALRPEAISERARQLTSAVTSSMPSILQPAPRTPFNGPISANRQFAWLEMNFSEIRGIRGALGGTVNDVVLTILSGALGRYLRHHGYRTEGVALRAMCPVSMRRAEERGALGNLVSIMIAPLYVDIDDPVERLKAEREAMDRLKEQDQAGGLYALTQLSDRIPPAWQAIAGLFSPNNISPVINTVSTNVPGPQIPLYLGKHKLVAWYPLGINSANIGLFVAILSYNQKLTFGLTVDPKLVPDVWDLIGFLRESFEEVKAAAERAQPQSTPAAVPAMREAKAAAPQDGHNGHKADKPAAERPSRGRRKKESVAG